MAGNCKYYKREMYVSMDSGQTWSGTGVYSQGALIESASTDCGYVPPTPPHDYSQDYLTFRPNGDTEYWFSYGDSENYNMISYSLNSGQSWTAVDYNEHTVTVHSGDTIMWRGYAENSGNGNGIGQFHSSGSTWDVEGNVMSLLYNDNFSGQTSLSGYNDVFPNLFYDCTNLTSAENMVLPATTLTDYCYYQMFCGCTSLTTAPTLPATTLTESCYEGMFNYCTSLSSITCLATNISATNCTYEWVDGIRTNGTFTTPSSTQWSSGKNGIPQNWTRVNA